MIIGKDDKKRVEELEKTYYEQQKKIQELKYRLDSPKEDDNKEHIEFLIAQIKDYKEREDNLLTIIKAIINKFAKGEIIIRHDEMLNAKDLKLIKQREYMSGGEIYRIVSEKNILDSYKEE